MNGLRPARELAADKPCGTRLRYMGGCRCDACRAANTAYERTRAKARRRGDWNGVVPADNAREHLEFLSVCGVGRRTVADITGLGETILGEIKTGKRLRCRARSVRAILSVTPAAGLNDATRIAAAPSWVKLEELLSLGFTKTEIAQHMGYASRALQFKSNLITARSAARIDRVYRKLKELLVRRLEIRAELGSFARRDEEVETVLIERGARRADANREYMRDYNRRRRAAAKRAS